MLKYKCLMCGIEWGDPHATESDISHGYCPSCIETAIRHRFISPNFEPDTLIASIGATMIAAKSAAASGQRVKMIWSEVGSEP